MSGFALAARPITEHIFVGSCASLCTMSAAERLISEALALSDSERAKVVHRLLESLEPAPEDQLDAAWLTELESRADAVEAGTVSPIPWEAAREAITTELKKRRAARSTP